MNVFNVMIPPEYQYPGMEQDMEGVQLLASTIEGTVPGNRNFGMDADIISNNLEEAENLFLISLIEKVEYYYSNLEVAGVDFEVSETGTELRGTIHLIPALEEEDNEADEEEQEEEKEDEEDE